jgi:predicted nucleic acid-binding protein
MTAAPIVYVVDASVAAQVVSPEPLTAQATTLFTLLNGGQAVLHVPDLFYLECANIFWKKQQRGVCSASQAVQALSDLLALPLMSSAHAALAVDALKLALALNITAYDACYLVLAERLGVSFITADQKLERKLAGSGRAIVWLGTWMPPSTTP